MKQERDIVVIRDWGIRASKVFIVVLIVVVTLSSLSMRISTNQLVDYAERVMRGDISESETEGSVINTYNNSDLMFAKSDCSIKTIFVVHNFKRGIMIVNYSFSIVDSNEEVIRGASNIFSLWEIEWLSGQWVITEIHERP